MNYNLLVSTHSAGRTAFPQQQVLDKSIRINVYYLLKPTFLQRKISSLQETISLLTDAEQVHTISKTTCSTAEHSIAKSNNIIFKSALKFQTARIQLSNSKMVNQSTYPSVKIITIL